MHKHIKIYAHISIYSPILSDNRRPWHVLSEPYNPLYLTLPQLWNGIYPSSSSFLRENCLTQRTSYIHNKAMKICAAAENPILPQTIRQSWATLHRTLSLSLRIAENLYHIIIAATTLSLLHSSSSSSRIIKFRHISAFFFPRPRVITRLLFFSLSSSALSRL